MKNTEIAKVLEEMSRLYSIEGDKARSIAYSKAASMVGQWPTELSTLASLPKIPGVGESIGEKLIEILETGTCKRLEKMRSTTDVPAKAVEEFTKLAGVGVKGAQEIWKKYKIETLEQMGDMIERCELKDPVLIKSFKDLAKKSDRVPWPMVRDVMEPLLTRLREVPGVLNVVPAGSYRRGRDTVRDVDIVVVCEDANRKQVMEAVRTSIQRPGGGEVKVSGEVDILGKPRHVDVSITNPGSFGACWMYLSGSKEHNVLVRSLAKKKGYTLNEYGLWKPMGDKNVLEAGKTEEEIYSALGLPFIPPELREEWFVLKLINNPEMKIPELVALEDLRGELHVHSKWSDGELDLEGIARMAMELELKWIGVSDHSQSLKIAHGLSPEDIFKQHVELQVLSQQAEFKDLKVYQGSEVELKKDGTLDYYSGVLKELDFVIASAHSSPGKSLKERYLAAIEVPEVQIIAHPTGRKLSEAGGASEEDIEGTDWDTIFKEAAARGVILEINGCADRLDLPDYLVRKARMFGCKFLLSSDCHGNSDAMYEGLSNAVMVARRAGLTKDDVINCRDSLE